MKLDQQFKNSLTTSGIIHLVLLAVFIFGFPRVFDKLPEEPNIITFEVLPISEINNVKTENIAAKKAVEQEKSREVKKSEAAKKESPKPIETKAEEEKVEKEKPKEELKDAEKVPEKKEEKKKEDKKPVEEKKQDNKKEKPKEKPKDKPKAKPKVAPKEEDSIDSILKNLEEESEGDDQKALKKSNKEKQAGTKKARGADYNEDSPLSITELMLIKSQIERNWRPPVGTQNLKDVRVILHMVLAKDGTVTDVSIKDVICPPNSDLTCKLTAESSVRAVRQASPIENLPVDRYDTWKEFNMLFDPSAIDQ